MEFQAVDEHGLSFVCGDIQIHKVLFALSRQDAVTFDVELCRFYTECEQVDGHCLVQW